jgi:hypothetical protein
VPRWSLDLDVDRQTRRIRRVLLIAALATFFAGFSIALDSDEGFGRCARLVAALSGYTGCTCRQCQEALLPWYDSPVHEVVSRLAALPVVVLVSPFNAGYVDRWIAGRNLVFSAAAIGLFTMFGRAVISSSLKRLARDPLKCAGCGYDLRGLPAEARCPECGHDRGAGSRAKEGNDSE